MTSTIIIIIILLIFMIYFSQSPRELYFDNNATTYPHTDVIAAINSAWYFGNPSSHYADHAKNIIEQLKYNILAALGKPNHRCIITSGASESINLLFRGYMNYIDNDTIFSYRAPERGLCGRRILLSAFEHKTSLDCASQYGGIIVNISDIIDGSMKLCRGDLLSIMTANNESGCIFPIAKLARIAHRAGAWFHTDMAQYFGKLESPVKLKDVDCISISFHKLYGPGIGALVIPADFPIEAQISGSQNDGLRGGTENIPLCAGAIRAMEITFNRRQEKNNYLKYLTHEFKLMLARHRQVVDITTIKKMNELEAYNYLTLSGDKKIIFLSIPNTEQSINTVLVSFINNIPGRRFCNIKFREELTRRNVKVSIGSACNTLVSGPSHVLLAMKLPFIVRCGVIRFSFGDNNTIRDILEFEQRCSDLL